LSTIVTGAKWLSTTKSESLKNDFSQSQANDYRATTLWIRAYLPYLIVFVTGYWTQLELYWILGTFSTDIKQSSRSGGSFRAFETAGQALSYGLNSGSILPIIPFYINCGLLVLVIPFMVCLIGTMPGEAPAEAELREHFESDDDPEAIGSSSVRAR
jgi:hypothetical protein